MCNYNTLKTSSFGYVVQCKSCDHIQVAFGTTIMSFTTSQYLEYIDTVDEQYKLHNLSVKEDQKIIHLPTSNRSIALIFSLKELKVLLYMLIDGRNALQYKELFVFNEN